MADGLEEFLGRRIGRPPLIAFECDIITSAADPSDSVDAREREGNKMFHRDCRWSPRPGADGPLYPEEGDRALVLLSDSGNPWIIEWTPYA